MQPLEVGYVAARPSVWRSNEVSERTPEVGEDEKLRQFIDDPMGLRSSSHHDPDCAWCAGYRRSIEFGVARAAVHLPYRALAGAGVHTPHGRVAAALDGAIARAAATHALEDPGVVEQVRSWISAWSGDAHGGGGVRLRRDAPMVDGVLDRVRDLAYRLATAVVAIVQG